MAILGFGNYRCEACRHFESDGDDGNHPYCKKQIIYESKAVRVDQECPMYEFGIPSGYSCSMDRNERRAYEVKAMMGKHAKQEVVGE